MSTFINIPHTPVIPPCTIGLPASKSESNRALIIKTLAGKGDIKNLSSARDTITMKKLLKSHDHILDVLDAGTTMRFLTAYLAVTGQDRIITGTERMRERPIKILVDALRRLGARIDYINEEGYPPIHIRGFQSTGLNSIEMRGDVSSQYISAILMISPRLKNGLTLSLKGKVGSRPYIDMTLGIMKHYGIKSIFEENRIKIPRQNYRKTTFHVSPDWSGASYWYSMVALAREASVLLKDIKLPSYQGDSRIVDIMARLGVASNFNERGLLLSKSSPMEKINIDFSDIPDLAQTVAVVCAAKGIAATFTGLQSLRIKETDRIAALQHELSKLGCQLIERKPGAWEIKPAGSGLMPEELTIRTYEDHRMAMAFAPLATLTNVQIENPSVVQKSYPTFWEDMGKAGFQTEYQD